MAHFCLLVVTRSPDAVADALRPFWDDDADDRPQPHFVFIEVKGAVVGARNPANGRFGYWKNPIGKWDGWVTGGRWSGLLAPAEAAQGKAADAAETSGAGDQCRGRELDAILRERPERLAEVYALLVHGRWRDAAEARAAGDGSWQDEVRRTLRGLDPDAWVTVVDCHC